MFLSPKTIIQGYKKGKFPMSESRDDPFIFWVSPEQRGIINLNKFRIPRSLKKIISKSKYQVLINKNFKEVCNKKMIEGITDDFIEIKYTTKSGSFNSESREKFFDSWYENFKINRYTGDYTHAVIIKYKAKAKEDEPIVHEGNCKVRQKKF